VEATILHDRKAAHGRGRRRRRRDVLEQLSSKQDGHWWNLPNLLAAWDAADPGCAGTGDGRCAWRMRSIGWRAPVLELRLVAAHAGIRLCLGCPPGWRCPPIVKYLRGLWIRPSSLGFPALAWAGGWIRAARSAQRLRLTLATVNRWLASTIGRTLPPVCREERSLEVFDDEKVLGALGGTALFNPGRLTLELFACRSRSRRHPHLSAWLEAGPVLIVENKATFRFGLARTSERCAGGTVPGYAAVVFGGGDQAEALVRDLVVLEALVDVRPSSFEIAGDVDVAGVSAAAAFVDAARARRTPRWTRSCAVAGTRRRRADRRRPDRG